MAGETRKNQLRGLVNNSRNDATNQDIIGSEPATKSYPIGDGWDSQLFIREGNSPLTENHYSSITARDRNSGGNNGSYPDQENAGFYENLFNKIEANRPSSSGGGN